MNLAQFLPAHGLRSLVVLLEPPGTGVGSWHGAAGWPWARGETWTVLGVEGRSELCRVLSLAWELFMNEVGHSAWLRGHPPGWAVLNRLGQKLSVLTAAAMRLGWLSTAPKEPDTLCTQEKFMHVGMCVYISAQLRCSPVPPAADLCSRDAGRGKFFASVKCFSSPFLPLPAQHDPPFAAAQQN